MDAIIFGAGPERELVQGVPSSLFQLAVIWHTLMQMFILHKTTK